MAFLVLVATGCGSSHDGQMVTLDDYEIEIYAEVVSPNMRSSHERMQSGIDYEEIPYLTDDDIKAIYEKKEDGRFVYTVVLTDSAAERNEQKTVIMEEHEGFIKFVANGVKISEPLVIGRSKDVIQFLSLQKMASVVGAPAQPDAAPDASGAGEL